MFPFFSTLERFRIRSPKQIHLRKVDDFISPPFENRTQHEQTGVLCLLIEDRWRHQRFPSRDQDLNQRGTAMLAGLRNGWQVRPIAFKQLPCHKFAATNRASSTSERLIPTIA
jgi:hypothetical protein